MAHRFGEVVQVDGGEAEEVVAAEPADRRHASFSPRFSLCSGRRRAGPARRGRRSIGIRDSLSLARRIAAVGRA